MVVPVSDVDRAKHFYCDQVGFHLDVDRAQGEFRVVQMTPPGSACSVTIGTGLVDSAPGSLSLVFFSDPDGNAWAVQESPTLGAESGR